MKVWLYNKRGNVYWKYGSDSPNYIAGNYGWKDEHSVEPVRPRNPDWPIEHAKEAVNKFKSSYSLRIIYDQSYKTYKLVLKPRQIRV